MRRKMVLTKTDILEMNTIISIIKSDEFTQDQKALAILSTLIVNQESLDKFLYANGLEKCSIKDFYYKLVNDKDFYNKIMTPNFKEKLISSLNHEKFMDVIDFSKDAQLFKDNPADKSISIMYPFRNLAKKNANGKFLYELDGPSSEEFDTTALEKMKSGFRIKNIYIGTNKPGHILFKNESEQSSKFMRKKSLLSELNLKLRNAKVSELNAIYNVFENPIKNNDMQETRLKRIIGNKSGLVNDLVKDDEKNDVYYKMESDIERICSLIYDNVLELVKQNKSFIMHSNALFAKSFGDVVEVKDRENVRLVSALLATKYIIGSLNLDNYATDGTSKAAIGQLDKTIARVATKIGNKKWVYASAHEVAKKIAEDYLNASKEKASNVANIFTSLHLEKDETVTYNHAMCGVVLDINRDMILNKEKAFQAQVSQSVNNDTGRDVSEEYTTSDDNSYLPSGEEDDNKQLTEKENTSREDEEQELQNEDNLLTESSSTQNQDDKSLSEETEKDNDSKTNLTREEIFNKYFKRYSEAEVNKRLNTEAHKNKVREFDIPEQVSDIIIDFNNWLDTYLQEKDIENNKTSATPNPKTPNANEKEKTTATVAEKDNDDKGKVVEETNKASYGPYGISVAPILKSTLLNDIRKVSKDMCDELKEGLPLAIALESVNKDDFAHADANIKIAQEMQPELDTLSKILSNEDVDKVVEDLQKVDVKTLPIYSQVASYIVDFIKDTKETFKDKDLISRVVANEKLQIFSDKIERLIYFIDNKKFDTKFANILSKKVRTANSQAFNSIMEELKDIRDIFKDVKRQKNKEIINQPNYELCLSTLQELCKITSFKKMEEISKNIDTDGNDVKEQLARLICSIFEKMKEDISKIGVNRTTEVIEKYKGDGIIRNALNNHLGQYFGQGTKSETSMGSGKNN